MRRLSSTVSPCELPSQRTTLAETITKPAFALGVLILTWVRSRISPCFEGSGFGEPLHPNELRFGRWETRSPTSKFRFKSRRASTADLGIGFIRVEEIEQCWGTYEHTLDAGLCWASCTPVPPAFLDGNLGISKTEAVLSTTWSEQWHACLRQRDNRWRHRLRPVDHAPSNSWRTTFQRSPHWSLTLSY